jgi:hypothetical protein
MCNYLNLMIRGGSAAIGSTHGFPSTKDLHRSRQWSQHKLQPTKIIKAKSSAQPGSNETPRRHRLTDGIVRSRSDLHAFSDWTNLIFRLRPLIVHRHVGTMYPLPGGRGCIKGYVAIGGPRIATLRQWARTQFDCRFCGINVCPPRRKVLTNLKQHCKWQA